MLKFKPIALNQNTCTKLDTFQFIKFAKKFDGVELNTKDIRKTVSKNYTLKDIVEALEIYSTKVESIYPLSDFSLCSERDFKTKILKTFSQMIKYCDKLESDLIIVTPSLLEPSSNGVPPIPKWRIINRTIKTLKELSKRAYKEDIALGFEFLLVEHSSISTLQDAKTVLNSIEGQENLGYILDTFYFAKYDIDLNMIKDIKDLIFLIRLADFDEKLSENIKKLFPGEGNFNFNTFHRYLEKLGYHKPFSIALSDHECSEKLLEKISTKFKYKLID